MKKSKILSLSIYLGSVILDLLSLVFMLLPALFDNNLSVYQLLADTLNSSGFLVVIGIFVLLIIINFVGLIVLNVLNSLFEFEIIKSKKATKALITAEFCLAIVMFIITALFGIAIIFMTNGHRMLSVTSILIIVFGIVSSALLIARYAILNHKKVE